MKTMMLCMVPVGAQVLFNGERWQVLEGLELASLDAFREVQGAADTTVELLAQFDGFEFEGMDIVNPTLSECGRFIVSPLIYGFEVVDTGDGRSAWRKDFADGSYILLTDSEGTGHVLGQTGDAFTLTASDGGVYAMQVGILDEAAE